MARRRKSILAGGLVLGLGAAATLAAWSDNVWVDASFDTVSEPFALESSSTPNGGFDQHDSISSPRELPGNGTSTVEFTTPLSLAPGVPEYAAIYMRSSSETKIPMTVTVGKAEKLDFEVAGLTSNAKLWGDPITNGLVTYGARVDVKRSTSSPSSCDSSLFGGIVLPPATPMFGESGSLLSTADKYVRMESEPADADFTLGPNQTAMVCFRFLLDSGADSSVDGASIYPYWAFVGTQ